MTAVCGAYYGTGEPYPNGTALCGRPDGHPSVAEDGIGHHPSMLPADRRAASSGPLLAEFDRIGLKPRRRESAGRSDRAFVQHVARSILIDRHRAEYEQIEDRLRDELGMGPVRRRPERRQPAST